MSWSDDRGDTVEDKLDKKLSRIDNDLDHGRYSACLGIPSGVALRGKPDVQAKADYLRERCSQKGIDGWLMANKLIVAVGTIVAVVVFSFVL
ncbi:MAG: hypothetical protein ACFB0D_04220 [Phormidesmis sp.]